MSIAMVIVLIMIVGGAWQVQPSPAFADMQRVDTPFERMIKNVGVQVKARRKAPRFTGAELQRLRSSGQVRLLVGAAMQMPRGDDGGTALLHEALRLEPGMEMIHVSLISRYLDKVLYDRAAPPEVESLRAAIEQYSLVAPENALASFLVAWQLFQDDRFAESVEVLQRGNAAPRFSSYARQRFVAITAAAQFLGYSRFTAYRYALGQLNPMGAYNALLKLCTGLSHQQQTAGARPACESAGRHMEASSHNILETLFALALQRSASRGSGWPDEPSLMARIDARRDELWRLIDRLRTLQLPPRYFDIFVVQSEEAAMRFALAESARGRTRVSQPRRHKRARLKTDVRHRRTAGRAQEHERTIGGLYTTQWVVVTPPQHMSRATWPVHQGVGAGGA